MASQQGAGLSNPALHIVDHANDECGWKGSMGGIGSLRPTLSGSVTLESWGIVAEGYTGKRAGEAVEGRPELFL